MAALQRKGSLVFSFILFCVLFLHFGVLEQSPMNPIGIKYVQEAYLAICLGFLVFFVLATVGTHNPDFNTLISFGVFVSVVFIVLPALFSMLYYGQPFYYGLIEERRVLFAFSSILLLYVCKKLTSSQLEKTILAISLLAVVLSWLCFYELLPDFRDREGADLSRPGRSAVGVPGIILSYCLCVYYWQKGKSPLDGSVRSKHIYAVLAMVFLGTLIFVTQTRQILLLLAIFTVLQLKGRAVILGGIGLMLMGPIVINPHLLDFTGINIDFYIQSAQNGTSDGVREWTVHQIFTHLADNYWLPSGSLSLMWNDGFQPYFGSYFFLSDVGVIGTLFRFGFLSALIIPISFFVYYKTAIKLNRDLSFILPLFVGYLAIWPLQGIFEYLQSVTAILFVFQAMRTRYRKEVPAPTAVMETRSLSPGAILYRSLHKPQLG